MDQVRIARLPTLLPGEHYDGEEWLPAEAEFCQWYEEPMISYNEKYGDNTHWLEFREVPDDQVESKVQAMYDRLIYSRTPEGQLETIRKAKEDFAGILDLPPQDK
ncbi:hypothetical protein [Variovorax sp. HJSM1_2]|uniref:hypothetical protein n=1 Tax=Variovorax sp. HJSM1_2 TaxID=3366263 RepID=UPI003BC5AD42